MVRSRPGAVRALAFVAAACAVAVAHAATTESSAESTPGSAPSAVAAPLANWEQALKARYTISRMRFVGHDQRRGLPEGDFFIYGQLDYIDRPNWWTRMLRSLGLAESPSAPPRDDPDALARQFLEREAELFGRATWQLEMNEENRRGRSHLRYRSYVGALRVDKAEVNVHVSSEGFISAVTGYIVHLPPHLPDYLLDRQQGGRVSSISKPQAARAVAKDMGLQRGHLGLVSAERRVIPERPFVVWRLEVTDRRQEREHFVYLLDERNGEVLERRQILRF